MTKQIHIAKKFSSLLYNTRNYFHRHFVRCYFRKAKIKVVVYWSAGLACCAVMHKMCSDERKCAVMKGCLCSDELRINKWRRGPMQYLLLREHKARCRNVKNSMRVCIEGYDIGVIICKSRKGRKWSKKEKNGDD